MIKSVKKNKEFKVWEYLTLKSLRKKSGFSQ